MSNSAFPRATTGDAIATVAIVAAVGPGGTSVVVAARAFAAGVSVAVEARGAGKENWPVCVVVVGVPGVAGEVYVFGAAAVRETG